MVAEVEAEQKAVAEAEDGTAARLARLRGIGITFAAVLGNEVFFRDFRNRREVGGYLGLAPAPGRAAGSGATRASPSRATRGRGAPRSSWPGCGCATSPAARSRGGSTSAWRGAKGRMRRIMLVAMARKLIVSLWRYVTTGTVPEGAVLKG